MNTEAPKLTTVDDERLARIEDMLVKLHTRVDAMAIEISRIASRTESLKSKAGDRR